MPVLKNISSDLYEDVPDDQALESVQKGTHHVPLNDPEDNPISVSYENAQQLLGSGKGYSQPTTEQLSYLLKASKYQTPGQSIKAAAEEAGRAATFGQSTGLERAAGVKGEDILGREEFLGDLPKFGSAVAGLAATAPLGEVGALGLLGRAGE